MKELADGRVVICYVAASSIGQVEYPTDQYGASLKAKEKNAEMQLVGSDVRYGVLEITAPKEEIIAIIKNQVQG